MARRARDEPYQQMMKSRAPTLFCPYEDCIDNKKKANGNIIFIRRYGTGETQNLFKCTTCKRTFSERRGTPLFECHLPEEKVYQILKCLSEGNGIRATSRIVGVSKDTVGSIINRIGDHMEDVAATLMTDYHLEECQLDELWGYIFKKEKNLTELECLLKEYGNAWIMIAFDPANKVVMTFVVGKRNQKKIDCL